MDLALGKQRALVTGASRGLGRSVALALASEGADVIAVARDAARLKELEQTASASPGTLTARVCDLAEEAAIASLADSLEQIQILVLNTGGPPPGRAADTADDIWRRQFESMFLSCIRLVRLALPGMRKRGYGRIIALVSSGVIQPIPNLAISNALRAALVGWAKTLSNEVASEGITVNCIAPGRIATDRVAELDQERARRENLSLEQVQAQSRATIPAGRYGEPDELASMALFLASPRASYVTGDIVRVDGGLIRSV
jgi:3-oxoacyl-[acyl-carrier protein] reductase